MDMKELLKDAASIIAWLDNNNIKKYTLKPDARYGFVVDGDVYLYQENLDSLPFKFGAVAGNFMCDINKITSLFGCPQSVGGSFGCSNNELIRLQHCPTSVGGSFSCYFNHLTSLEFSPVEVGKDFNCSMNGLKNLMYCPASVGEDFNCSDNEIATLEYVPVSVGRCFFCENSALLGDYQDVIYFAELKDKITSDKEKALLCVSLEKSKKSILHKV